MSPPVVAGGPIGQSGQVRVSMHATSKPSVRHWWMAEAEPLASVVQPSGSMMSKVNGAAPGHSSGRPQVIGCSGISSCSRVSMHAASVVGSPVSSPVEPPVLDAVLPVASVLVVGCVVASPVEVSSVSVLSVASSGPQAASSAL